MTFGIWDSGEKMRGIPFGRFFPFRISSLSRSRCAPSVLCVRRARKQRGERERLPRALLSALAIEIHYVNLPSNRFAVIRVFERSGSARSDVCFRPKKKRIIRLSFI